MPGFGKSEEPKEAWNTDDFIELLGKCTPSQQRLIYQIAELIYKNGIEMN